MVNICFEKIDISSFGYQDNYILYGKRGEDVVGYIEFVEYDEEVKVLIIEVFLDYRRTKIETQLIKHLQSLYPDKDIEIKAGNGTLCKRDKR